MQPQPGDLVRLKAFGGKEIVRRFVGQQEGAALICSEDEYQAANREGRKPECVGFPVSDVIRVEKPSRPVAA